MDDQDVVGVGDWITVLKRRWLLVSACVVLVGAAAAGLSLLQTPTFSASAEVLVSPAPDSEQSRGSNLEPEEIATQMEIIRSESVAMAVLEDVAIDGSFSDLRRNVAVEQSGESSVVEITATASTADLAARVANSYANNYLDYRRESILSAAEERMAGLVQQMQGIREDLSRVERELARRPSSTRSDELTSEKGSLLIQLTQAQAELSTVVMPSPEDGGELLVSAKPPAPSSIPAPARAGALGAVLGLLLGVGLAFLRDRRDDAIHDESILRKALPDLPVLGRLPRSGAPRGTLVTVSDPHGAADEAYRALASSIRFLLPGPRRNLTDQSSRGSRAAGSLLLVTSAGPEEGKTAVATNLAVAAARFGLRVVLVDGDLRGARIAALFGHASSPGLADLARHGGSPDEALVEVGAEGLRVLPAGSPAPNPAELLASAGTRRVLTTLALGADLVVVDTGPVGAVADTLELIRSADAPALFVVRRGRTRGSALAEAVELTHQIGGRILGVVFNDVDDLDRATYGRTRPRQQESPGSESSNPGGEQPKKRWG